MFQDFEDQFDQPKKTKKQWEKKKKREDAQADPRVWVKELVEDKEAFLAHVVGLSLPNVYLLNGDHALSATLDESVSAHWVKDLVIGDQVFVRMDGKEAFILARRPRTSSIVRMRGDRSRSVVEQHVLAANVEVGVIVAALANPEFHPRFIDRYLAVLQDGNVSPLICLTKADLTNERHLVLRSYRELGIPVIETSRVDEKGIEELKKHLCGKMAVFVGQSGVGKSTLVNLLAPHIQATTGEVTEKRGTGKHTTTRSSLYEWDKDSFIIDTPGIRSLGLEDIPKNELKYLFPEFEKLGSPCKFSDCLHIAEPGCVVKRALEEKTGEVHHDRYDSYLRMMQEA